MSLKTVLFLLLSFLCTKTNAQSSTIAKDYFKAIKKKSILPIAPYFLTTEQLLTFNSWPKDESTINLLDSMQSVYEDSLIIYFDRIDATLKESGFNLKRSKLIKSEIELGLLGNLTLTLSHRKKTKSIFIDLLGSDSKCYLIASYPSLTPPPSKDTILVKFLTEVQFTAKEKEVLVLSDTEIYNSIEKKHNKTLADNFLLARKEKRAFDNFVDSLKTQLIEQSGGYIEKDGRKIPKGKKDKDTPHRIFILEGKGNELRLKIASLEKTLRNLAENTKMKNTFQDKLPLKIYLDDPKEREVDWAEFTFDRMPIAAIFPMLRKFHIDAKVSEAMIINYLLKTE
jgi:hypothetical protein